MKKKKKKTEEALAGFKEQLESEKGNVKKSASEKEDLLLQIVKLKADLDNNAKKK